MTTQGELQQLINKAETLVAQCRISANQAAAAAASIGTAGLAPLESPLFTGDPRAPTPAEDDASLSIVNTAWMGAKLAQPSGIATLDSGGLIPLAQLPFAGLTADGTWSAATNTPTLVSGSGVNGHFRVVTVAGSTTLDGVSSWAAGDWALFSGGAWTKVPYVAPPISNLPLSSLEGIAPSTVVANLAGGTATPTAVTVASLTAALSVMVGAGGSVGGVKGLVPAGIAGDNIKFLRGDGTWQSAPTPDLSAYAPLNSPVFTGTPTSTTPARGTNSTVLATTAFVLAHLIASGDTGFTPVVNGTAAGGTAMYAARADHIHGTDLSRASLVSPAFAGTPTAPTAARATNTTQLATTAYVISHLASAAEAVPKVNGTATNGTGVYAARIDHIHPTDTSRAPTASPTLNGTATVNGTLTVNGTANVNGTMNVTGVLLLNGSAVTPSSPIFYTATLTPTVGSPNATASDTGLETVTITGHGLATGQQIYCNAGWGAAFNGMWFYVRSLSSSLIALYSTRADALADTNRLNITASITNGTWRKLVATSERFSGLPDGVATGGFGIVPGAVGLGLEFNTSSGNATFATKLSVHGFSVSATSWAGSGTLEAIPTNSGGVVSFTNANIPASNNDQNFLFNDHATQGTTPFNVGFMAF